MKKHPISVLVVENKQPEKALAEAVIDEMVRDLYIARDWNEGLRLLKKYKPDLVLTDIKLQDTNSLDIIDKIKQHDKYTKVVVMSTNPESQYLLQAIEYGVKGFLIKPFNKEKLQKLLKQIMFEILKEKQIKEQNIRKDKAEKALKQSEEILMSVSYAAEQFLKFNYGSQSITKVLKRIGEATGVSRVYIFQNFTDDNNKIYTRQQFEWTAENIKSEIDNPAVQNFYLDEIEFDHLVKQMRLGKAIYCKIRDCSGKIQKILKSQNILSIAMVPIYVYNDWWGFIGFDDYVNEREWTVSEIRALMAAANILGAAILRKQVEIELLRLNNELESRINTRTTDLQNKISESAQIEQMLRESEEKYRQIFENANDGILLSVNGIIEFINPKLFEMTGYLPKEAIGKPFIDFLHPDYREMVLENHWKRLKGEEAPERYDIKFLDKAGNEKWFEIKSNLIQWEGDPAVLTFLTDITERKQTAEELQILNRNLEKRVQEELEKIKHQQQLLIQKSKLESLGELAAGMAHEINQPLGSISMGLENIYMKYTNNSLSEEYLKRKFNSLFQDISRIKQIIEHIRIFSRDQQTENFKKVSINDIIINALSLITTQYKNHKINLSLELPENDYYIYGNKYKVEQIILNLLSNAKFAVDEKLHDSTYTNYQKHIIIKTFTKDNSICINVEDNGVGIPEDIITNIFDPFFTTKKADVGTGLGLSIIYGIVKEMKGEINVESKQGEYTRMTVVIPEFKEVEVE
jgi:PAS domain S-box-containing protein